VTKENNLSLSCYFNNIVNGFAELKQISNLRVDLKAEASQKLAVESIQLTGLVIQALEKLESSLESLRGASHDKN